MAHKSVCLNNQKQIGIARQLYAVDNEGYLVPALMADTLTPPFPDRYMPVFPNVNWQDILCNSYLDRNTKLFECPANAKKLAKVLAYIRAGNQDTWPPPNTLSIEQLEKEWGWGYLANYWGYYGGPKARWGIDAEREQAVEEYLNGSLVRTFPRTIRDSDVVSPSQMIAQGDASRYWRREKRLHIANHLIPLRANFFQASPRHFEKVNVLFADGHVSSESLRQLFYPSLDNWIRFNYDIKKHWRDSEMPDAETWQPPTPLDETLGF